MGTPWLRLSLTQRLTLFFSAIAVGVVLSLGAIFLSVTEHHFAALDQMSLQDKRQLIEKVLHGARSPDEARQRLGEVLDFHDDLAALVRDAQGARVFESNGAAGKLGPTGVSASRAPPDTHAHAGAAFRVLAFESPAPFAARPLRVWIVLDTGYHAHFIQGLRRDLALYALAALLVCGLLSWLAARQGLAPLIEMRARAARVSGHALKERMPIEAVPVELADLAQALNHMLERLQGDFQRLTDFSSDLAHELRTPINNLLTQTQVALATPRDADTYRDILASNVEEFERLARMVSDMLLLAKTEHGVDVPHRECFSARDEAQALLAFYDALADEKRVRLRLDGDGCVAGDRLMFRRALSNLLSNALRHAPDSGEVAIHIAAAPPFVSVDVANTGAPIDAKTLPRLFDRFYRADPSRAHPGSEGTGLGLAITRAIALAHGGGVTATSAGGRTHFILTFPAGAAAA